MRYKEIIDLGQSDIDALATYDALFGDSKGVINDFRMTFAITIENFTTLIDRIFGKSEIVYETVGGYRFMLISVPKHQILFNTTVQTDEGLRTEIEDIYNDNFVLPQEELVKKLKPTTAINAYKYCTSIQVLYKKESNNLINRFVEEYDKFKISKEDHVKGVVYVIKEAGHRLSLHGTKLELVNYGDDIIQSNYNEDFSKAYDSIVKFTESRDSGLVLLKGPPGTGKTSFILHLVGIADDLRKKFVIVPSSFGDILTTPTFMTFALTNLKNTILVVEDAEHILRSRKEDKGNQAVTNILNITDGILGSALGIKVLVTINVTDNLDDALLRKGRLKGSYYFDKLTTDKANTLLAKLNKNERVSEPTSLANLYNVDKEVDFGGELIERKSIGFNHG